MKAQWFAESVEHARGWGELLGGVYRVIVVEFQDEVADSLFRIYQLDHIGPARYADKEQLSFATIVGEVTA